ncbi:hypothetical protein NKH60_14635, partial [Mesorhizobium sp. M1006]|uniref:hypothetical protein n=1 Tax=Mesorhizobium sp. M1006 TaxID=2957048 RepID=UPI0033383DF6
EDSQPARCSNIAATSQVATASAITSCSFSGPMTVIKQRIGARTGLCGSQQSRPGSYIRVYPVVAPHSLCLSSLAGRAGCYVGSEALEQDDLNQVRPANVQLGGC